MTIYIIDLYKIYNINNIFADRHRSTNMATFFPPTRGQVTDGSPAPTGDASSDASGA